MTTLSRTCTLLVILFGFHVTPAFSAEEVPVPATATAPTESTISKTMARNMLREEAVKVSINSPIDGSTIKAMSRSKLKYTAAGDDVAHASLYVDGVQTELLRKRSGTHKLAELPAGPHELCVKALNKSHKAIGTASCVKVVAQ